MTDSKQVRRYDSEIRINQSNEWIFRGDKITLEKVLSFFKENLHEDSDGLYITNQYGKFSEEGFLHCEGFPLFLDDYHEKASELLFHSDAGKTITLQDLLFFTDASGKIFCMRQGDTFIRYGCTRKVLSFLAKYMQEREQEVVLVWREIYRPIQTFAKTLTVLVPEKYRNPTSK
ncbi:MAG: hypothetical protein AAF518_28385 [Spirochaetota bacterium]